MCLTSIPSQFQEIEDFNFDDYDSEYLENGDFGNDDTFFSEFLESFNPTDAYTAVTSNVIPATNNTMSFGACGVPVRSAPMVSTNLLKAKTTVAVVAQPVSASNKHDMCGKNKRIKKRRRRAFATDDPRRTYVDSIFGAINAGDGVLSTLERIAHPDVLMTCRFLGDPSTITTGKLYREVKGRELISKFVDCMLMSSPDAVLKLHEKKMRLRQNNSSYIVAKYTLEGYKFCDVLTTNDKHVSKKLQCSMKGSFDGHGPSHIDSEVSFAAVSSSSGSIHDDDDDSDDDWGENFLEISSNFSGSPLNLEHADPVKLELDISSPHSYFKSYKESSVDKSIQERSEMLLQASQFKNRQCSISGYDQKVSIASSTTEFGLSKSLSSPVLVSTIGTMALHINPNRQVYKIEFLWTYNKAKGIEM